ncbi:unnamed protein product [Fusarium graminearum]|nr:unnamed protein product [Fusarium graminearum]
MLRLDYSSILALTLMWAFAHDGMRLSRAARKIPFKHNCVYGEGGLHHVLAGLEEETSVFILVEAVYSMDGDVAPLRDIVSCVQSRLAGNGYIIVDEAHSTGIYGQQGQGLVCELGLEKDIFARLHTFGKAMSSFGAEVEGLIGIVGEWVRLQEGAVARLNKMEKRGFACPDTDSGVSAAASDER